MQNEARAKRKQKNFTPECLTSTLMRCLRDQRYSKKLIHNNQEFCNNIINTRELARITVGNRSFHDIIIIRFLNKTPTQSRKRIRFTSLYQQDKIFFAYIDEITMIQEYHLPPILNYHSIRYYLGLKKSFEIPTPSVITEDRGKQQPGNTPHHDSALLQTLTEDYPITSQKLIKCLSEHTSLTRFYKRYAHLSESSRRWLHGQGLIQGFRRVLGPVKDVYEHPIVHAVEVFLNKIFRSVKTRETPSPESKVSTKYMGLDFYFVKAKEEEIRTNSNPRDLTQEWDKIEREVANNGKELAVNNKRRTPAKDKDASPNDTTTRTTNRRKGTQVPPVPIHVYTEIPVMTEFQFQKFAKGKSLPYLLEVIRYSNEYTSQEDESQLNALYERFEYTGFTKGSYKILYISLTHKLAPSCFRRAAAMSRLQASKHSLEN